MIDLMLDSGSKENCSTIFGMDVLMTLLETRSSASTEMLEYQSMEHDAERVNLIKQKDIAIQQIAAKGIQAVFSVTSSSLSKLHDLLLCSKPKVNFLSFINFFRGLSVLLLVKGPFFFLQRFFQCLFYHYVVDKL
jgi:hypothetical protein